MEPELRCPVLGCPEILRWDPEHRVYYCPRSHYRERRGRLEGELTMSIRRRRLGLALVAFSVLVWLLVLWVPWGEPTETHRPVWLHLWVGVSCARPTMSIPLPSLEACREAAAREQATARAATQCTQDSAPLTCPWWRTGANPPRPGVP